MPFHDDLIPREISQATREIEDFVRPVTDPVRRFVAKAIPKEIKPFVAPVAAMYMPFGLPAALGGQFMTGFATDLFTQKLIQDPDDDTDIDYLGALLSGVGRSVAKADIPSERFADPASKNVTATASSPVGDLPFSPGPDMAVGGTSTPSLAMATPTGQPPVPGLQTSVPTAQPFTTTYAPVEGLSRSPGMFGSASEYQRAADAAAKFNTGQLVPGSGIAGSMTAGDTARNLARATDASIQSVFDPATAFSTGAGSSGPISGPILGASKLATGATLTRVPAAVQAAKDAEDAYEDYLNQLDERQRASGEAFEEERKQAYLGTFRRRGIDVDTTLRVMQENGINVTREEIEESRATAARGGRIGFDMGGMSYKDVEERYAEGLTEEEYIRFIELSPAERREEMTRAGVLRDDMARGGRVGFAEGTQVEHMTIGDFVKAEEARTKFLDQIQRKMQAQEFNMRQNQPSGISKLLNLANPFDRDPMRQQPIMDMKTRYMDLMFDMRKKSMEDATKLREEMLREEMRKKNRKDDFNNIVDMLDDRFSENRQQRKTASKGGRMTPEGDPISPDVPKGMQMDLRNGGFIPLGTKPRADDVPAMVGKNEFVLNDRAVSGIGKMLTGNPDPRAGARALYQLQDQMEAIV